jgi:hypothetical protein
MLASDGTTLSLFLLCLPKLLLKDGSYSRVPMDMLEQPQSCEEFRTKS